MGRPRSSQVVEQFQGLSAWSKTCHECDMVFMPSLSLSLCSLCLSVIVNHLSPSGCQLQVRQVTAIYIFFFTCFHKPWYIQTEWHISPWKRCYIGVVDTNSASSHFLSPPLKHAHTLNGMLTSTEDWKPLECPHPCGELCAYTTVPVPTATHTHKHTCTT